MKINNSYTGVAKLLHWTMAILIIIELFLAYFFGSVRHGPLSGHKAAVYWLHFNIGYTILLLLVLRIIWRLFNKPPALPDDMDKIEAKFAHYGHVALYLMMITMVVTGVLRYNIHSGDFNYLNLVVIPSVTDLHGESMIYTLIATLHNLCGALLLSTIAVHAAMAIRHHVIDKNDILLRMLPKCCSSKSKS